VLRGQRNASLRLFILVFQTASYFFKHLALRLCSRGSPGSVASLAAFSVAAAYDSANIAVRYPGYRTVEEVLKERYSFERFYFHIGPEEGRQMLLVTMSAPRNKDRMAATLLLIYVLLFITKPGPNFSFIKHI
jgi:hypothetical protein